MTAKLVPVGYGIKKLQIATVIEDDKVSTEVLEEMICEFEDHVSVVWLFNSDASINMEVVWGWVGELD